MSRKNIQSLLDEVKEFRSKLRDATRKGSVVRTDFIESNIEFEKNLTRRIKKEFDKLRTYEERLRFWAKVGFEPYSKFIRMKNICISSREMCTAHSYNSESDISIVATTPAELEMYLNFCLDFEKLPSIEEKFEKKKAELLYKIEGKDVGTVEFIIQKELHKAETVYEECEKTAPEFNYNTVLYDGIVNLIANKKYLQLFIPFLNGQLEMNKARKESLSPVRVDRLRWLGSPEQFGFIFLELAAKGFIEIPGYRGDSSFACFAETCLKLFDIRNKSTNKETTVQNLKRALNPNKNQLSNTSRRKFSIPYQKDI